METLRFLQRHLPPSVFDVVKLTNGLLLLVVLFVPLERLWPVRPKPSLRKGWLTDVGYYYLSSLLPNRLLAFPLSLVALGILQLGPWTLHTWVSSWPGWARFVGAMLVGELGFYWGHRLMHRYEWLWRFHVVHHSPVQLDWLVNTHAHPVDLVFTRLCGYVPIYLLGFARPAADKLDWVPLLVALVGASWGYFIHANMRWRFGWLEHLISTPGFHHWHHENEGPLHRHRNYAPLMPWVDRLFGTLHLDRAGWPERYGVDEPVEPGLVGQLVRPFLPAAPTSAPPEAR